MSPDARLLAAAILYGDSANYPESIARHIQELETALASLPPQEKSGEPGLVPVGWVRDSLSRLDRWVADDLDVGDPLNRLTTIAAVLVNLRAELRQFAGEP